MFYDLLKGLCGFPRIAIGQNKIRATNDLVARFPSDGLLSGKIEKAVTAWPTSALLLSPFTLHLLAALVKTQVHLFRKMGANLTKI